jgi:hypothetical protein
MGVGVMNLDEVEMIGSEAHKALFNVTANRGWAAVAPDDTAGLTAFACIEEHVAMIVVPPESYLREKLDFVPAT